MAEFLIALGASREADFNFLLRVLQCQMYDIAEMILYENNSLADGKHSVSFFALAPSGRNFNRKF